MSQRIIYTCDKCGVEIENPNRIMIQNMGAKYMNCIIDLCDDCAETFVVDTIDFLSTACPAVKVSSYLDIPLYEEMPPMENDEAESVEQPSADIINSITYKHKEDNE